MLVRKEVNINELLKSFNGYTEEAKRKGYTEVSEKDIETVCEVLHEVIRREKQCNFIERIKRDNE